MTSTLVNVTVVPLFATIGGVTPWSIGVIVRIATVVMI